ncbi:MAG: hypothetical protein ACYS3S_11270 [Planctomycetota bacterium]|jgi:hypothetical protein
MEDTSARLLTQIVAKLRNPVLLFTISFGLILLSIGIYDVGKISTLVVPLLVVFVSGLVGSMILHIASPDTTLSGIEGDAVEISTGVREILPNRNWTSQVLSGVDSSTRKIKILAVSGQRTSLGANVREKFASMKDTRIEFLLLSPSSDFVVARLTENPARSLKAFNDYIKAGIDLLRTTKQDNVLPHFHVRLYDEMPAFRLLIIDQRAYVSYYPKEGSADRIPVLVFEQSSTWLYSAFEKHFDVLWDRAQLLF